MISSINISINNKSNNIDKYLIFTTYHYFLTQNILKVTLIYIMTLESLFSWECIENRVIINEIFDFSSNNRFQTMNPKK